MLSRLIPFKKNDLWGYKNILGQVRIEPKFEMVRRFSEEAAPANRGGLYGFIDKKGEWIIKPMFDNVERFSEGVAAVKIGGLWGCTSKKGKVVFEPKFENSFKFSDGLAVVCKGEYAFEYIDLKGNKAFDNIFLEAEDFVDGIAGIRMMPKGEHFDSLFNVKNYPKIYIDKNGCKANNSLKRRIKKAFKKWDQNILVDKLFIFGLLFFCSLIFLDVAFEAVIWLWGFLIVLFVIDAMR